MIFNNKIWRLLQKAHIDTRITVIYKFQYNAYLISINF